MGKIVFPVFHHVDPSHVRTQRGSYGRWMVDHERKGFDEKIQRWRAALREVGYISGWHVQLVPHNLLQVSSIFLYILIK